MLSKLRLWFINQKNFLKLSKFIILTISLLLITWLIDHIYPSLKLFIPKQLLLSVEVSVNFLSNISGVFLTISIFCFTTIVTVLNKYSSSISPRLLQSFIDRTNVISLYGIFVSGFFYSVITILLLQDINPEESVVAGSFGIAYSIIAMIGFIIFSKRVLENIKISNIIEGVYLDCDKLVDKELELRENAKRYNNDKLTEEIPILAESTGYLFKINSDAILKKLEGMKAELTIDKRIGEYTIEGESLGYLKIFTEERLNEEEKEKLREKISSFLVINIFNNSAEDYHHGIIMLTEIANMALSPGTNDPNTAITCINKISSLLGKLLSTANQFIVLKEDESAKIIYEAYSVEDELYLVFSQIISYSSGDPMVTKAILQGIYMIYMMAGMSAKKGVKNYFNSAYDILMENFSQEIYLSKFSKIRDDIDKHLSLKEESELN
ncbi:DUF2254 family protein [Citroniella saccharovorans]|uniref:DUF2254 family protein n=1 Tax=Citroniella saccharovorans TaxID=2053367 RepID=A0AAW9MU07_9FIRM|nr:DUF2254 family protein [Citroniella saccharovorans]MEB3429333.1 DUF2254 family protein [Citroniella saccharovorans]